MFKRSIPSVFAILVAAALLNSFFGRSGKPTANPTRNNVQSEKIVLALVPLEEAMIGVQYCADRRAVVIMQVGANVEVTLEPLKDEKGAIIKGIPCLQVLIPQGNGNTIFPLYTKVPQGKIGVIQNTAASDVTAGAFGGGN